MFASLNRLLSLTGRIALGLLVVAQLLFLGTANLLGVVESYSPEMLRRPLLRTVRAVVRPWADWTGQPQNWSLFAPSVGEDVVFPAVELRWRDGRPPLLFRSDNEPDDRRAFFRLGGFRLRRWESLLTSTVPAPDAVAPGNRDEWNRDLDDILRRQWRRCHAYLVRRREQFRSEQDGDSPDEVVLLVRRYRIPPPDRIPWDWAGPDTFPLARLLTEANAGPNRLPVERYNPVIERFEWMPHNN